MPTDTIAKFRVDERRKLRWRAQAAETDRSLSAFIRNACDAAAEGIDPASIRADLVKIRRFLNAATEVSRDLDQDSARRVAEQAAEIRRLVDRHLAIGSRRA
ncbi:MAG: hypothetical protein WAP03_02655 [Methylorubrum rhodinum]|uniref:hypothetical protein n=1 Tax=Methylorubrum rhodinum TaxID=29428 RepID=UPI003BB027B3